MWRSASDVQALRAGGGIKPVEQTIDRVWRCLLLLGLFLAQLLRVLFERCSHKLDLRVGQVFDANELFPCLVDRAQEFVELRLHRRAVPILAVLDQEHHQEGDDGGPGIDDQLPCVGIME